MKKDLSAVPLHFVFENIGYGLRLKRAWIQFPVLSFHERNSDGFKERDGFIESETREKVPDEKRILSMIPGGIEIAVGYIALAVTGYGQFSSRFFLFFENGDRTTRAESVNRGHHSRRTGSDNRDPLSVFSHHQRSDRVFMPKHSIPRIMRK